MIAITIKISQVFLQTLITNKWKNRTDLKKMKPFNMIRKVKKTEPLVT
jgi:hypothetical protein